MNQLAGSVTEVRPYPLRKPKDTCSKAFVLVVTVYETSVLRQLGVGGHGNQDEVVQYHSEVSRLPEEGNGEVGFVELCDAAVAIPVHLNAEIDLDRTFIITVEASEMFHELVALEIVQFCTISANTQQVINKCHNPRGLFFAVEDARSSVEADIVADHLKVLGDQKVRKSVRVVCHFRGAIVDP